MKNLTKEVQRVFDSTTREEKIKALTDLINTSHATKKTKILSLQKIVHLNEQKLDAFAANYMLSGEGMKVI